MDIHKTWATAVQALDSLMCTEETRSIDEPRLSVERIVRNVVLCGAPTETFSEKMPTWTPPNPEYDELRPIDVLYGTYRADAALIEIYFNRIERDAHMYGGTFEDLLGIVRLHEYAHAVLHLGVRSDDAVSTLRGDCRTASSSPWHCPSPPSGTTDWRQFRDRRTTMFSALDSASHEFLAQAITYACLCTLPGWQAKRLRSVFEKLEAKQPREYFVPADIKRFASQVDWSLILQAARQEINVYREDGFSIGEGLLALVRQYSGNDPTCVAAEEWVAEVNDLDAIHELKTGLLTDEQRNKSDDGHLEFVVDRFRGLKVEVFSREHPPPHFRITCAGESACYMIADCTQLNGSLRQRYRAVRKWHAANKSKLIAAWNERRPSDCPVGEYREA